MTENQVSKEQIEAARKLDLLSYLQRYEPSELVKVAPGVYSTRTNDSLKISNGKWFRWSRGYGGVSALDYLVKVREMDFVSAVRQICGRSGHTPASAYTSKPPPKQPFILPERNGNNDRVIGYLQARGIHLGLIRSCINTGRLYEDRRHNCVFVGFDKMNVPRFGFVRSTDPSSTFMHEVRGSNKACSFSLPVQKSSQILNVFESAIDALSYVSLELMEQQGWKQENYLALSGIYQPRQEITETPLPIALAFFLNENPQIEQINLCFDNDRAGTLAARAIIQNLGHRYEINYKPPECGKDYNELLMKIKGLHGISTRKASQLTSKKEEQIR